MRAITGGAGPHLQLKAACVHASSMAAAQHVSITHPCVCVCARATPGGAAGPPGNRLPLGTCTQAVAHSACAVQRHLLSALAACPSRLHSPLLFLPPSGSLLGSSELPLSASLAPRHFLLSLPSPFWSCCCGGSCSSGFGEGGSAAAAAADAAVPGLSRLFATSLPAPFFPGARLARGAAGGSCWPLPTFPPQ